MSDPASSEYVLAREAAGMTQEDLAARAKVSIRTIRTIETGGTVKAATLAAVRSSLGLLDAVDPIPGRRIAGRVMLAGLALLALATLMMPPILPIAWWAWGTAIGASEILDDKSKDWPEKIGEYLGNSALLFVMIFAISAVAMLPYVLVTSLTFLAPFTDPKGAWALTAMTAAGLGYLFVVVPPATLAIRHFFTGTPGQTGRFRKFVASIGGWQAEDACKAS